MAARIEGHAITKARTMVGEDTCLVEDLALRPQAENSIGMVCGAMPFFCMFPICAEDDAWGQVASQLLKCFEQRPLRILHWSAVKVVRHLRAPLLCSMSRARAGGRLQRVG